MTPRIGITTSVEDDEQRLSLEYVQAVERAGGCPVLLPVTDRPATARRAIEDLHGLVIPGGPAVTVGLVGDTPDDLGALDPRRDAADGLYLEAFWTSGRPILGICYGMQRLNAYAGGTIYGDVEAQVDGAHAHSQKRGGTTHPVRLRPGSRLHRLLGDTVVVNTRHLQALATLGDGFEPTGTAPDGVVEAIEHESGKIIGIQFHPERMGEKMAPLFEHFVQQCAREAASDAVSTPPTTAQR